MLTPEEINFKLNQLIEQARPVYPNLARRLDEMSRWIRQKQPGHLRSKPHVMQLLDELVADSTFWLRVQSLSLKARDAELAQLSPVERYWYEHLFPAWFNEKDPKLDKWKKKLMAGKFSRSDETLIDNICKRLETSNGDTLNPYIADLSMCTDLIVSGTKKSVLCVQLTTVQDCLSGDKHLEWKETLEYWEIERGLFVSFNPRLHHVHLKLAKTLLLASSQLPEQCYHKLNIDC